MSKKVYLTKDIGTEDGITAEAFRQAWPEGEKEVELIINSCGGSCIEGTAIGEFIHSMKAEGVVIHAKVEGIVGSISTQIALCCSDLSMTPGSQFFIHEARTGVEGTADELDRAKNELNIFNEAMKQIYMKKTGLSYEEISKLMKDETLMNSETAKSLGFIDKIVSYAYKAVALFKREKPESEGHVFININQVEDSENVSQEVETVPIVEVVEEEKTETETVSPTTEETPVVVNPEVEDMKKSLEEMRESMAKLALENEELKVKASKDAEIVKKSEAFAKKLGEVVPPQSPKFVAKKNPNAVVPGTNLTQIY